MANENENQLSWVQIIGLIILLAVINFLCPSEKTCTYCEGTGKENCSTCSGKGTKDCSYCYGSAEKNCPQCNGVGRGNCTACNGMRQTYMNFPNAPQKNGQQYVSYNGQYAYVQLNNGWGNFPCQKCSQRGQIDCNKCNHTGKVECDYSSCEEGQVKCTWCYGEGKRDCTYCYGKGKK